MTTYKFYKNMIVVSFDDSNNVIMSDSQMLSVLQHLSLDFIQYYVSLPLSEGKYFFHVHNMITNIQLLRGAYDTQFIIDMLRDFLLVVQRFDYPEFRIIFVDVI